MAIKSLWLRFLSWNLRLPPTVRLLRRRCQWPGGSRSAKPVALMPFRKQERRTLRHPSRRAACVAINAVDPPLQCVIWDFSDAGARLAIARRSADLPNKFTLVVKDGGVRRDCQVVWTDGRFVGVQFIRVKPWRPRLRHWSLLSLDRLCHPATATFVVATSRSDVKPEQVLKVTAIKSVGFSRFRLW
jgi:hypothetical protein